ncbi:MAG: DksA/TraR family C4-type zinc finger protein [Desulfobacteraceae bacterium]
MAGGWSSDGAVHEQIDASVEDAVRLARSRITNGESLTRCEQCGEPISEARQKALPGVRLCIECRSEFEKKHEALTGFNRRAGKDSQLK